MKEMKMEFDFVGRVNKDGWDCYEWDIHLSYDGKEMETKFYTGLAIDEPKLDDVLSSLLIDSRAVDYESFEQWAREFDYDTDSRRAEKIYHECIDIERRLNDFLGDDKGIFEQIYEDY